MPGSRTGRPPVQRAVRRPVTTRPPGDNGVRRLYLRLKRAWDRPLTAYYLILGGSREGISADLLLIEFLKIQELPEYDKLKQDLTSTYWRPGDRDGATKKLDEWLEKYSGFPSLWYLKGVDHLQRGELLDLFAQSNGVGPFTRSTPRAVGTVAGFALAFGAQRFVVAEDQVQDPPLARGHRDRARAGRALPRGAADGQPRGDVPRLPRRSEVGQGRRVHLQRRQRDAGVVRRRRGRRLHPRRARPLLPRAVSDRDR